MVRGKKFISIIFKNKPKDSLVSMLTDFLKGLLGNHITCDYSDNFLSVIFDAETALDFEEINVLDYISHIKDKSKNILETNLIYVDDKTLVKLNLEAEVGERNIFKSFYDDLDMLDVVKKYLDCNMNISQAANMLYMHRNTVMNKIDKFIAVTGYDIKKFSNAFIIYKFL